MDSNNEVAMDTTDSGSSLGLERKREREESHVIREVEPGQDSDNSENNQEIPSKKKRHEKADADQERFSLDVSELPVRNLAEKVETLKVEGNEGNGSVSSVQESFMDQSSKIVDTVIRPVVVSNDNGNLSKKRNVNEIDINSESAKKTPVNTSRKLSRTNSEEIKRNVDTGEVRKSSPITESNKINEAEQISPIRSSFLSSNTLVNDPTKNPGVSIGQNLNELENNGMQQVEGSSIKVQPSQSKDSSEKVTISTDPTKKITESGSGFATKPTSPLTTSGPFSSPSISPSKFGERSTTSGLGISTPISSTMFTGKPFSAFVSSSSSLPTSPFSSFGTLDKDSSRSFRSMLEAGPTTADEEKSEEQYDIPFGSPSKLTLQEQPVATGEEDEMSLFTSKAKLYRMDEQQNWKERGVGQLKLNVKKENYKSPRLVMRADAVLRVILNIPLFEGMSIELEQEKFVRISAIEDKKPAHLAIKFGNSNAAKELYDLLLEHIPTEEKAGSPKSTNNTNNDSNNNSIIKSNDRDNDNPDNSIVNNDDDDKKNINE